MTYVPQLPAFIHHSSGVLTLRHFPITNLWRNSNRPWYLKGRVWLPSFQPAVLTSAVTRQKFLPQRQKFHHKGKSFAADNSRFAVKSKKRKFCREELCFTVKNVGFAVNFWATVPIPSKITVIKFFACSFFWKSIELFSAKVRLEHSLPFNRKIPGSIVGNFLALP